MGRKYALDGAIVQCSMGMKPAKLMVITNNKVKIQGKFKATDTDLLVPETFFQCKLKPTPSGAFLPCIPMLQKWQNTAKKTNLRGIQKFLYDDSYTMCMPGSRITIVNPMQINAAGAAFEQYTNISTTIPGAMPLQGFDEGTLPEDDSSNGFLDGFQTVLDIAGLVPGFGEIADGINAAIYVARGDYANAALSAAAMIPIGGQAATAAKLGMKSADAVKTVAKNADEVIGTVKPKSLLPDEGDVGTYKDLIDAGSKGDNITPHHMPSDKFMKSKGGDNYKYNDGAAMNMEQPHPGKGGRHRDTATYNNNMTKAEKEAYLALSPRDALAKDIRDARKIYTEQGLYNEKIKKGLQDVIKLNKEKYPDVFGK